MFKEKCMHQNKPHWSRESLCRIAQVLNFHREEWQVSVQKIILCDISVSCQISNLHFLNCCWRTDAFLWGLHLCERLKKEGWAFCTRHHYSLKKVIFVLNHLHKTIWLEENRLLANVKHLQRALDCIRCLLICLLFE